MKNQFFYSRKELIKPKATDAAGQEAQFKTFRDSFNISKIIRSVELENNELLVLLDDLHQRLQDFPVYNKQGKQTATRQVSNAFQSEIYITVPEDIDRFRKLTNIEE